MNWRSASYLYRAEMTAALRERNILFNTIFMPALLYPILLWVMFNGLIFIQGQTETLISKVHLVGLPEAHQTIASQLEEDTRIQLVELPVPDIERALSEEDVDAVATFRHLGDTLDDNFAVSIAFDSSREKSALAKSRLSAVLESYRDQWLRDSASDFVSEVEWLDFVVSAENVATGSQMGAMVLGLMLPIYFVLMVAVGCMYPAIDSTAGERERGTWETTLTMATDRLSIVTAKYLYVTTLGFVAGALNLAAMSLTMGSVLRPLLGSDSNEIDFGLPLAAIPLLLLGSILLAASVAAAMMLFAAFARTFKEGQAMVAPIYVAIFLPVLFLTREGLEFTAGLAAIPVVNVAMMVREAIRGSFPVLPIVLTMAVQGIMIAGFLRLAAVVLSFEDVVTGSYEGNLFRFFKARILSRSRRRTA